MWNLPIIVEGLYAKASGGEEHHHAAKTGRKHSEAKAEKKEHSHNH
jgi:hypothetical protein